MSVKFEELNRFSGTISSKPNINLNCNISLKRWFSTFVSLISKTMIFDSWKWYKTWKQNTTPPPFQQTPPFWILSVYLSVSLRCPKLLLGHLEEKCVKEIHARCSSEQCPYHCFVDLIHVHFHSSAFQSRSISSTSSMAILLSEDETKRG